MSYNYQHSLLARKGIHHHSKLVSKENKLPFYQGFGEYVCNLFIRWNILKLNCSLQELVSDEMISNLNVFWPKLQEEFFKLKFVHQNYQQWHHPSSYLCGWFDHHSQLGIFDSGNQTKFMPIFCYDWPWAHALLPRCWGLATIFWYINLLVWIW